jgi:hypothetical protein
VALCSDPIVCLCRCRGPRLAVISIGRYCPEPDGCVISAPCRDGSDNRVRARPPATFGSSILSHSAARLVVFSIPCLSATCDMPLSRQSLRLRSCNSVTFSPCFGMTRSTSLISPGVTTRDYRVSRTRLSRSSTLTLLCDSGPRLFFKIGTDCDYRDSS